MNVEFGKGKTLRAMTDRENRKVMIKKWFPFIMLFVGFGLVVAGLLVELGVV